MRPVPLGAQLSGKRAGAVLHVMQARFMGFVLTQIGHQTLGRLPACVMQHASGLAEGVAGYVEA